MRIRLIVERADFPVSAALVEGLGLGKCLVGFETKEGNAPFPREVLETLQDTPPDPQAAGGCSDPHAFDLAIVGMALEGTAPDWLTIQGCEEEEPLRRGELLGIRRNAERRIEAGFEARGQLLEIAF